MNKYFVQFTSRTLASLSSRRDQQKVSLPMWKFSFPGSNISLLITDFVQNVSGLNLHCGLNIVVETVAAMLEDAEAAAKSICEELLNLITFVTGAFCEPAKHRSSICFETVEAAQFKNQVELFEEQPLLGEIVPIDQSDLEELFQKYFDHGEQQRLSRALSWLRSGINEDNSIEEFKSYWIGVEVLKSILRRRLKLLTRDPGEWDGVIDIYENVLKSGSFKDVKELREGLLHGYAEMDDAFINSIKLSVPPLRKALCTSLATILTISGFQEKTIRRLRKNLWQVVRGRIENVPQCLEQAIQAFPSIRPESVSIKYQLDEKGILKATTEMSHRLMSAPDVKWHVESIELWGDEDAGMKDSTISVT